MSAKGRAPPDFALAFAPGFPAAFPEARLRAGAFFFDFDTDPAMRRIVRPPLPRRIDPHMSSRRDYYATLGVTRSASAEEIRSAHRRLARELHPDVNKKPDAAQRFNEVQEAYDILSDADKRAVYDRVGHAAYTSGVTGGGGSGSASSGGASRRPGGRRSGTYNWSNIAREPGSSSGGGPGAAGGSPFTAEDIGSIFDEFFGARSGRSAWREDDDDSPGHPGGASHFGASGTADAAGAARARARTADLEHTIEIPFLTALSGGVQTLRLAGADAADSQTIDVTIPKGIADGARLRLRGRGGETPSGAARDLILIIRITPHPRYRREGLDISADLPVSITEAALGVQADVLTAGGAVGVRVPPGTPSGARLRLKGRGAETPDGKQGDFYAVVKIVPPPKGSLSADDEAALRALGERLPRVRE